MLGILVSLGMVAGNILINMHYVKKYQLTIGLLNSGNYFLMQGIMAKPWSHIQNVG